MLVLSLGLQAGVSRSGEALVYADPARLEIVQGQVGTLHIKLANANAAYGIDLQATFDPAAVEIVDADSNKDGVQVASGAFLKPDFTVRNLADNQAGTLWYVVTQLKPTAPANGKGIVLSIRFRGKVAGTSSKLTISSAVIADSHGNKQAVKVQGAELVIVRPNSTTPTPTPTPTHLPAANIVPGAPTWVVPSLTPLRPTATAQPSPSGTPVAPTALPYVEPARNSKAWVPESGPAEPVQATLYIDVGAILGVLLLIILLVWLLRRKRAVSRAASK